MRSSYVALSSFFFDSTRSLICSSICMACEDWFRTNSRGTHLRFHLLKLSLRLGFCGLQRGHLVDLLPQLSVLLPQPTDLCLEIISFAGLNRLVL
jgi:hypothetical protein